MKITDHCQNCILGLVQKTVELSGGDNALLGVCAAIVRNKVRANATPPEIANEVLRIIRERTGVYDPFSAMKEREFEESVDAFRKTGDHFPHTLEGVVKLSALGNSSDFFVSASYDALSFRFAMDMDKIVHSLYNSERDVLILGDNMGDFIFDLPLITHISALGKHPWYAVKEHPVQNDLSMPDVEKFGLRSLYPHIVSTGTGEVGMRREDMRGIVKELWEKGSLVIAKGMGNYETISEYREERPVVHIMKIKCPAVAHATGHPVGTYVATTGGENHGS